MGEGIIKSTFYTLYVYMVLGAECKEKKLENKKDTLFV
jgi:hypothetical protein